MFVWHIQATAECKSNPEMLYKLSTDVSHWSEWNSDIEWARLDTTFCLGATGIVKPKDSKPISFRIAHVEKNRRFSVVIKKFLTTIVYRCEIVPVQENKVQITEGVVVGGLLAPLYKRVWGKNLQQQLPLALQALVKLAKQHI